MGDAIDDVQARDVLLVEEIHRVGLALAEDRDQYVGAVDFLLARGLHVEHRALQHALEAQGRLGIAVFVFRQQRGRFADEFDELTAQRVEVGAAGAQHLGCGRVVQQRQQQMLDGHEFVALFAGLLEGHVERDFEFFAKHCGVL